MALLKAAASTAEPTLAAAVLPVSSTETRGSLPFELLPFLVWPGARASRDLLHRGGDNLGREGEVSAEVVEASEGAVLIFSGEVAIVVLGRK